MSDIINSNGHEDLNTAILRVEAYLQRLEKVTERLERMAEQDNHDK